MSVLFYNVLRFASQVRERQLNLIILNINQMQLFLYSQLKKKKGLNVVSANSGIKGVKVISGQALHCTQVLQLKKKKRTPALFKYRAKCSNIETSINTEKKLKKLKLIPYLFVLDDQDYYTK